MILRMMQRGTWLVAAAVLVLGGCSRGFYRKQADDEVYCIVDHAAHDPRWRLDGFTIEPDPRSRMFDPACPDRPPMPPDDPHSHRLMQCVDGKQGYPQWHCNGDTDQIENPDYLAHLPLDDEGHVVLNMATAVQTAFVNSPSYQNELEDVYLSALDVSFERFRFDVQFFGGYSATFTADGRLRNGDNNSSSELALATTYNGREMQARKLFTTGGELVVGLANSIVWQFSGPDTHSYNTLLDFSLVQPLLRAGGRDKVMERLTISERALLANLRQMERYRQAFVTNVVTGRDVGQGPQRRGGFFGGAGLSGFSGVGAGGFGRVGGVGGGAQGGDFGAAGGAGAARAGGFLGLLQDQQEIRNQEANVAALRSSLERLTVSSKSPNLETGAAVRLRFQLELARQALHNAESRLVLARNEYRAGLDRFKLALGIAPEVKIEINDPLLDRFQLIDARLTDLQAASDRVLLTFQPSPEQLGTYRLNLAAYVDELARYERGLRTAAKTHEQAVGRLDAVKQSLQQFTQAAPQRRELMTLLNRRVKEADLNQEIAPELLHPQRVDQAEAELKEQFQRLDRQIADAKAQPAAVLRAITTERQTRERELAALPPGDAAGGGDLVPLFAARQSSFSRASAAVRQLSDTIADMWLVQAKARVEAISLAPIELNSATALQVASENRLDWMNNRASLVDAWRLVQFNADDLDSNLDLVFSGDMGTVGKNPVKFDAATGRLRVGAQFDAPLTRLAERNNYRQSLIEYQQAKRNYYRFVDGISLGLRSTLRTIEVNQLNFELRRAAVHTALTQVDLAREQLLAPVKPDQPSQTGDIGRDLVSALADLAQVQNDFLSVWLNYRVQQMALDLDLGTFRLDHQCQWVERTSFDFAPREPDAPAASEPPQLPAPEDIPAEKPPPPLEKLPEPGKPGSGIGSQESEQNDGNVQRAHYEIPVEATIAPSPKRTPPPWQSRPKTSAAR